MGILMKMVGIWLLLAAVIYAQDTVENVKRSDYWCTNTCSYSDNGHCEDGGPGSIEVVYCASGTDCNDCGPRTAGGCTDTCFYSNSYDGGCHDGGPGSVSDWCELGTDCTDCGFRVGGQLTCTDICGWDTGNLYIMNGLCEDGGPDSTDYLCALGTDCFDCGERLCDNSCSSYHTYDGMCEDGGPGSTEVVYCALGTDCKDCGPRSPGV